MIWLLKDFDFLSVLLRAASLSLEALVLGGLLFLLLVALPGGASDEQRARVRRMVAILAVALAGAQAGCTALAVTILMGGSGFPFGSLVTANFFLNGCAEVVGALVLAVLMRSASRRTAFVAALPGACILAASVAQSHGAARLEDRPLLVAFTALHHLGTAGWVGAMLFLLLTLRVSPSFGNAKALARRYSVMALVSVPTLILAGVGMSFFYVKTLGGLYGTTYGFMIIAKTYLLGLMLLLGAGNFQLLRSGAALAAGDPPVNPLPNRGFLLRLRRFSEAEIGLGITAVLAAASLTSQPPAVDLQRDRLSAHEIVQRVHWESPRLHSPTLAELTPPVTQERDAIVAGLYTGWTNDAMDRAWSEYNHHWAGMIVLFCGLFAFAARVLPPGRLQRFASNWPLLFIGLGVFIVLRADPENWPLGPRGFWQSFASPDVLQHRLYAVLIVVFALFELTHSHGFGNIKEEMLAELAHTPIAVMGATAGWGRWLQLRLPGTRAARTASFVWPLCLALVGFLLLDYRES